MCGLGGENRLLVRVKHIKRCLKWNRKRIVRGYSDMDKRNMYAYLQTLISDMLQRLRDHRMSSPHF